MESHAECNPFNLPPYLAAVEAISAVRDMVVSRPDIHTALEGVGFLFRFLCACPEAYATIVDTMPEGSVKGKLYTISHEMAMRAVKHTRSCLWYAVFLGADPAKIEKAWLN
jgi:hypothetical protein